MITWKTETRKIKDLKPHPKNPRKLSKHDAAHLQKSLEKFGLIDKPIITADGLIIGGHQRIAILKKMKHKEVECYVPEQEMTDKDIEELNIRLNRNNGEWDFDILANEFDVEDLLSYGFTEVEFSISGVEQVSSAEEDASSEENQEKTCPKCGNKL